MLDPARYGFSSSLSAVNDRITTQMSSYATMLEAAEASSKHLKDIVGGILKVLNESE